MENPVIQSEDTSSTYHPANEFNIAAAFPVTDEIVKRAERLKWQNRFRWVSSHRRMLVSVTAGIVGVLFLARSRR